MFRITQRSVVVTSLQGLNRNLAGISKLQEQLTSGKTINKPSDDPTGTHAAMRTRQDLAAATQYARNISDGTGVLDTTDSTLRGMITQVQKVRDLTVQALNDGAMSGPSRAAIQTELSGIRESLLGQANTTVQGQPLFGGVTAGKTAYNVTTGAYQGLGGTTVPPVPVVPVTRQVSEADAIRVDVTGPEAFGDPASGDLFALVGSIATDVVADPSALAGHLTDLDTALDRMLKAAADIGTRSARMDTAKQVNADLQLTLTSRSADIENVDLAKTIMNLQMQQTGYSAALSATAKAIQPTLLDFLR
ncbi:MAG: Flagellar hook-associated protein 3 [Modestobacter sp.]|jgi:flagellar hook-associated protein 3 FlgL|nr:Flagellar hook-associated protein 3 [Modestobacter sp.]MCW2617608.1 Flagellar hook-associated protein 3 [Modestobacter sp.]